MICCHWPTNHSYTSLWRAPISFPAQDGCWREQGKGQSEICGRLLWEKSQAIGSPAAAPIRQRSKVQLYSLGEGDGVVTLSALTTSRPDIVKIVIRGDHCTGKSTLLGQLHRFSVTAAASQTTAMGSFWFMATTKLTPGQGPPIYSGEGQPYVPTRQIQVANLTWKYKGTTTRYGRNRPAHPARDGRRNQGRGLGCR